MSLDLKKKFLETLGMDFEPKETPVQKAKDERVNKSSKIQTALEGTIVEDLAEISDQELAAVERFRDETLFGHKENGPTRTEEQRSGRKGKKGMIIADDIRETQTTINRNSGLLSSLGAMGVGAALLYAGMKYMEADKIPDKVKEVIESQREFDYNIDTRIIDPE